MRSLLDELRKGRPDESENSRVMRVAQCELSDQEGNRTSSCGLTDLATNRDSRHSWPAMNVAIEIPDAVSGPLQSKWHDLPGRALEAIAAEAYRSGALTAHQVGQMLGHSSRWQTEEFLKRVQAFLQYTEADLDRDLATLRESRAR